MKWLRKLLHKLERDKVYQYTFHRRMVGPVKVVQVYEGSRLVREFNCGGRMMLHFAVAFMARSSNLEVALSVLDGCDICITTEKKLF